MTSWAVSQKREFLSVPSISSPGRRFNLARSRSFNFLNEVDVAERILLSSFASKSVSVAKFLMTGWPVDASEFLQQGDPYLLESSLFGSVPVSLGDPLLVFDLASKMPHLRIRHRITFNEVSLWTLNDESHRVCFKPHSWSLDPNFTGLEDTVEDGTVDDPARILDTKFLTSFDLATTRSS